MVTRELPLRVAREYLLREAEHFRDHKKGIPEWIKNSDDSYTRHEEFNKSDFSNTPILINISKKEIVCLDFGGTTSKDMIEYLLHFGSSQAATQGKNMYNKAVSGGHGNGGKYYALSQFEECQIITYYEGKLSVLRLNKSGQYADIEDEDATIWKAIEIIGLDKWYYFTNDKVGSDIFRDIKQGKLNLFCWKGIEPRDKKQLSNKKNIIQLLGLVANHPQSRSALKCRKVSFLLDGEMLWPSMKPQEVDPDESFGVREFSLPNELEQFRFNKYSKSILNVVLSREPLTGEKSSLNILEIDAFGKNKAFYEIPQLLIDKGLSKSLYAHIDCPELVEYMCISNDRIHLIEDLEVTNLFLDWCKAKLKEVLEELTNKEKKKEERKHLEELGSFLKEITKEISELLVLNNPHAFRHE